LAQRFGLEELEESQRVQNEFRSERLRVFGILMGIEWMKKERVQKVGGVFQLMFVLIRAIALLEDAIYPEFVALSQFVIELNHLSACCVFLLF
jgi:hypothetical protein